MTAPALMVAFDSEAAFLAGLDAARNAQARVIDAFAPYLPDAAAGAPVAAGRAIVRAVVLAGVIVAALFYGLEWWSAVDGYALNAGGRPLDSWQTFVLGPVELGVFAAGLAGVVTWLIRCGLPAPWHPAFDIEDFERVSRDRFVLALEAGEGAEATLRQLETDGVACRMLKAAAL